MVARRELPALDAMDGRPGRPDDLGQLLLVPAELGTPTRYSAAQVSAKSARFPPITDSTLRPLDVASARCWLSSSFMSAIFRPGTPVARQYRSHSRTTLFSSRASDIGTPVEDAIDARSKISPIGGPSPQGLAAGGSQPVVLAGRARTGFDQVALHQTLLLQT